MFKKLVISDNLKKAPFINTNISKIIGALVMI